MFGGSTVLGFMKFRGLRGLRVWGANSGLRRHSLALRLGIEGFGFRVSGSGVGFRVQGFTV